MDKYQEILKWWGGFLLDSPENVDKYLNNFRILFAYNSGKIENNEISLHDTREIFENGKVLNYTGSPRTIFELENQKKCYDVLKYKIAGKEPITIELIKEMHLFLTAGTYDEKRYIQNEERSGEFKKHDYVTGRYEVGSSSSEVEGDLEDLISEVVGYQGQNYLKVAAYLHAGFEYIHPFADGNGRVGRTLMNYYLMTNGHPPLIIYDKDKALYYDCLEKYDAKEELKPLVEFLQYELEQTWEQSLKMGERKLKKLKEINIDS